MQSDQDGCSCWNKMMDFAKDHPIKFVSLGSFLALGAVPIAAFLAYVVTTLVASVVGLVVVEVIFVIMGTIGLGSVLCCAGCVSMCVTSCFGALYMTYRAASCAASCTAQKTGFRLSQRSAWPSTSTTTDPNE